ncbi:filament-like plant protein 4 [Impatiens glandulifera]|uniref:filament-like plant protein 4 n=1 Tax=Impatiens glandulifera TaxID=253017 RepID=UPI001FB081FB|nr:filament-like plant protein 4 [Impatiens glandulifera]XP_047319862.1 filament-like plant protein 4 [Impatiens glandulifera]
MDRRSWPWKKKSSDKSGAEKAVAEDHARLSSSGSRVEQDKKPNYIQISMESYSHLTGLEEQVKTYEEQMNTYEEQANAYEDQVKSLEDEISELNEKLSAAQTEITTKESMVKQHVKVAEEAVSGWEKAEAEALALKTHLESVTLLKLTAEDRSSHLDGALKECMKQIRNLKEEHEHELHDVVLAKTKQWDKIRLELESKINNLNQEIFKSEAENSALSRSLQERSNLLVQISDEKSQAEAEIELLKGDIESCERQMGTLKYEVHIINKELEIRNEEKNMSVRSAEVANKQYLDGVKKIAKLEAECQRLRGLMRKKLPGPAALAQMKIEVDNLGRDYGDSRVRKSNSKPSSPYPSYLPELSLESFQKYHKENEALTEKIFAMEEETKHLKDILSKRDNELQASRSISAKTIMKLKDLESQLQASDQNRSPQIDDAVSCTSSSDISQFKKVETPKSENSKHLELMDDFLEMEKLAYSSNCQEMKSDVDLPPLVKLQSRISMLLESTPKDTEIEKVLDSIKHVVEETEDSLHLMVEPDVEKESVITEEISAAISQIHEFVLVLGKEVLAAPSTSSDKDGLTQKIDEFSSSFDNFKSNLHDLILRLSHVLSKASELHFNILGFKDNAVESNASDCIDKIALPENPNTCTHFSDSTSDTESFIPTSESNVAPWKCSFEEFEQLNTEKETLSADLTLCRENLENTIKQLQETEQVLTEVRSELANAQKMNGLSETQLKCMAESYNSLDVRAKELESQVNLLLAKMENTDNELQEERRNHQDSLDRCKGLQEQLQSLESVAAELESKNDQEKELTLASEKLAECQETIFLLGKQLKMMRPPKEHYTGSPYNERIQRHESIPLTEEEPSTTTSSGGINLHEFDQAETDTYNSPFSPSHATEISMYTPTRSPINLNQSKQRNMMMMVPVSSSSSSNAPTPDKHSRGFTRFFSSKR